MPPSHARTQPSTPILTFGGACRPGPRILVAAVGDLLFHDAVQRQALARGSDWKRLWQPVQPVLAAADIVYGNLEGPAADGVGPGGIAAKDPGRKLDGRIYGKAPGVLVFNYHPSVLADLKASGFTVVSTANNHAADRGALGIDRTIENLRRAGLAFTGTRKRDEATAPFSTLTRAKGLTVAWLACSYSTNGMPDRAGQVLDCYKQRSTVMDEIRRLAADPGVDAVILTPHWGQEYASRPLASDRAYAREAIEAGAAVVLGAHPHVLQPWEHHRATDGREGLIVYSLGNFVSNQQRPEQRSGIIALIELTRPLGETRAVVTAAGFVPTWVEFTGAGHRVTEMKGTTRSKSEPLAVTLARLPAGNRVPGARPRDLPRACVPELIAAVDGLPAQHRPRIGLVGSLAALVPHPAARLPAMTADASPRLPAPLPDPAPAATSSRVPTPASQTVVATDSTALHVPADAPMPPEPQPRRTALRIEPASPERQQTAMSGPV